MLNGARKKHWTEVTKIGQNNHSFLTVHDIHLTAIDHACTDVCNNVSRN